MKFDETLFQDSTGDDDTTLTSVHITTLIIVWDVVSPAQIFFKEIHPKPNVWQYSQLNFQ